MPLDLATISPKGRDRYLRIGRAYGSSDTLKQANKTLHALDSHASALLDGGFASEDAVLLEAARNALIDAGVGRDEAAGKKRSTSQAYLAATTEAKGARARARSVLVAAHRVLEDAGCEDAARTVETTLDRTSVLPDDAEKLATQLDALRATLSSEAVVEVAKKRGGTTALLSLTAAAASLRAAAEAREGTGTQLSTEQMDVIDGIIVTLCRSARNTARLAAASQSQPALLKAFALTHIKPPSRAVEDDGADEASATG
ncbi:hypothetical protein [Polyangium mundeleinium]|uniref:Uncharacterized protein n=1 Tax=Polyangium mundeleinium TaxID=2995306 RepID=A0ABT5EDX1_9BACT|nr:hypothetical protein [Polyangium mundeleinium]MDC0740008.1 hypothetical protein [Polyangium mundeleinium]